MPAKKQENINTVYDPCHLPLTSRTSSTVYRSSAVGGLRRGIPLLGVQPLAEAREAARARRLEAAPAARWPASPAGRGRVAHALAALAAVDELRAERHGQRQLGGGAGEVAHVRARGRAPLRRAAREEAERAARRGGRRAGRLRPREAALLAVLRGLRGGRPVRRAVDEQRRRQRALPPLLGAGGGEATGPLPVGRPRERAPGYRVRGRGRARIRAGAGLGLGAGAEQGPSRVEVGGQGQG